MVSATLMGVGAIALTATVGATPAVAAPATSQTTHFSTITGWNTPIGPLTNSGCPAWAINDNVYIDMVGNGVEHFNINGAGDSWYTTTFTGNGTIGFYAGTAHYDANGNITSVDGPAEQTVTGHLTQWFGFEANRQNSVGHGTVTFNGTVDGTGAPITLHFHQQAVWSVGSDPNGPPDHLLISVTHC
jgi:hypothetical protein